MPSKLQQLHYQIYYPALPVCQKKIIELWPYFLKPINFISKGLHHNKNRNKTMSIAIREDYDNYTSNRLAVAFCAASLFVSQPVFAEQVPIVRVDAESCTLRPWHQLGGCFQNKTGKKIHDENLYYRQSIDFSDKRTRLIALIEMNKTEKNNFIVISTAPEVLRQNHIAKVTNELVAHKSTDGVAITGCRFEISENAAVMSLGLMKDEFGYRCG
jgi:hypothetical protein